jgi:hypothetical protein
MNVETHARHFLSDQGKKDLMKITDCADALAQASDPKKSETAAPAISPAASKKSEPPTKK